MIHAEERKQKLMEMEFHQNAKIRVMELQTKHKFQNWQLNLSHDTAIMNQRLLMKQEDPHASTQSVCNMFPIIDLSQSSDSNNNPPIVSKYGNIKILDIGDEEDHDEDNYYNKK